MQIKGVQVIPDLYYVDTNKSKKFKSLSHKATKKSLENLILAKGMHNSRESM